MAVIVASAAGGNWNTNGAWVGGVQPSATSDVQLNATSGPITTTIGNTCRSLDCTGYTNTLTLGVASSLAIGDGTTGASNIALKLVAAMTLGGSLSTVSFVGSSATTQTITLAGKSLAAVTFTTGKYQFQDAFTAAGILTFTAGTLDMNGQTVSVSQFVSTGAVARTLTLGAAAITCTLAGSLAWSTGGATNLTVTTNTATVTCNGAAGGFSCASQNMNGLSVVLSGSGTVTWAGSATLANVTRTGTAATTDILSLAGNITATGTFTVNGNSAINRMLVQSSSLGTPRTITAAVVAASYVDFSDTTGAGAGNWNLSAAGQNITGGAGDAGGNSGITFTTAATQTWQGTTSGSWSNVAKWTSRIPLPQDDVAIASAFSASQTITLDMPRCGKSLDCTGTTGAPTLTRAAATSPTFYGSITLVANVLISNGGTVFLAGRSSHTLTTTGVALNGNWNVNTPTGTYTLGDALTITGAAGFLIVTLGTFDSANYAMSVAQLSGVGGTMTLGTSAVSLVGLTGTICSIGGACTFSGASASFTVTTAAAVSRTFTASAKTFGTITYTVADSPGPLQFFASLNTSTVNTLNVGPGHQINVFVGSTLTVGAWNVNGRPVGYQRLPGVAANYVSTPDSVALSITGDIDIRLRLALDRWQLVTSGIFCKAAGTPEQSWRLISNNTGTLRFDLSNNGTTLFTATSSVAPTIADGAPLWVRVTWRASDGRVQFFTASGALTNPVAADFTQLGSNQTISIVSVPSIKDSTSVLEIGTLTGGTGNPATGRFYRAQVRNGIDGTLVFDADLVSKTVGADSFAESSSNAATVAVNGTVAQVGDGRATLASSTAAQTATVAKAGGGQASSDFLVVKDSVATGQWFAGAHGVNGGGNTGWLYRDALAGKMLAFV